LQAGRRLSAEGFRVILLEAAAEPGGRILELTPEGFPGPVEGGAEFVHGSLPLSLALMKEAGIAGRGVKAEMVRRKGGAPAVQGAALGNRGPGEEGPEEEHDGFAGADWGALLEAMAELTEDLPMAEFLATRFGGERYATLRESARRFAEGYDLADLNRVSTLALYKEWSGEEGEEEWRPVGGYRQLIDFLVAECRRNGADLHYSTPVTQVSWGKRRVEVSTADGRVFTADTLVVSVSLGVLASGDIRFSPVLPEMEDAVARLGFGSVIKILLAFRRAFWLSEKPSGHTLFILSDQPVPTWWTQTEEESHLLTGWLAGDRMHRFLQLDEAGQLDSCLRSVAALFSRTVEELQAELTGSVVLDWAMAPYIKGGYSYETVGAAQARSVLFRPFEETIYLCGEALYEGGSPGTVEAALQSGWDVVEKIIAR